MKIRDNLLLVLLSFAAFPAYAEDGASNKFYRADNYCSSIAQDKALSKCNYNKKVKNYYIKCMNNSGYNNDNRSLVGNNYNSYMRSHNQCTTSANYVAQKRCKYINVYNTSYSKCMLDLGFDEDGNDNTAREDYRSSFIKMYDGITP